MSEDVSPNAILGLRSVSDPKNEIGEKFKAIFQQAWYFDNWYEKISLVILMILGFIKLMELIF